MYRTVVLNDPEPKYVLMKRMILAGSTQNETKAIRNCKDVYIRKKNCQTMTEFKVN